MPSLSIDSSHGIFGRGRDQCQAPCSYVMPKSRDYSFLKDQATVSSHEGARRSAYFLGLGDAIIPTILVISANWSLPAASFWGINLPALGAMLGTYLGFFYPDDHLARQASSRIALPQLGRDPGFPGRLCRGGNLAILITDSFLLCPALKIKKRCKFHGRRGPGSSRTLRALLSPNAALNVSEGAEAGPGYRKVAEDNNRDHILLPQMR